MGGKIQSADQPDDTMAPAAPGGRWADFTTTDHQRAEAYLSAAYGNEIKVRGDRDGYRFRHARLGLGPLHLDAMQNTGTSEYAPEPLPLLLVLRIRHGIRTDLDSGDRLGAGDLTLDAQPGQPHRICHQSVTQTAIAIPLHAAADAARNHDDERLGPLIFTSLRPADTASARRWQQTVDYATATLQSAPLASGQPLLHGAMARLLAATMLTTFPNSWITGPDPADRTDATPATVTRATTFIEAHADCDISVADVARAAHVTARAVQLAFRRHLGTTPTAYLRQVRLRSAHNQLRQASVGDGTTVTAVAYRWGFPSASRFASYYRSAYGQAPSRTLRN